MKLICVCLLCGLSWDLCGAATLEGTTAFEMKPHPKSLRATGDGNQANNMNVGFVPLISIIANLLPRFFTRYATVPQATVQQARSITIQNEEAVECQKFEHVGLKWLDQVSPSTFYQCHFSKQCFNNKEKSCFQVRKHFCKQSQVFNAETQKCATPFNKIH